MGILTALMIGSIVSALAGAGASIWSSYNTKHAMEETNQANRELVDEKNENQINLQQLTNDLSIHEADKNRAFQERLSNTAHQREMADLKAAGLNPILAAGGSGATSPMGSVASLSTAQLNSAQDNPASLDLSGLANVFNSLSNTMLTQALISGRIEPYLDSKADYFKSKTSSENYYRDRSQEQFIDYLSKRSDLSPSIKAKYASIYGSYLNKYYK